MPSADKIGFRQRQFVYPGTGIEAVRPDQVIFMKYVAGRNNPCFFEDFATSSVFAKFLCAYLKTRSPLPAIANIGQNVVESVDLNHLLVPNYYEFNTCQTYFGDQYTNGGYECYNQLGFQWRTSFPCYEYYFNELGRCMRDIPSFQPRTITGCGGIVLRSSPNLWTTYNGAPCYNQFSQYGPAERLLELTGKYNALKTWTERRSTSCPDYQAVCHGAKSCDLSR